MDRWSVQLAKNGPGQGPGPSHPCSETGGSTRKATTATAAAATFATTP